MEVKENPSRPISKPFSIPSGISAYSSNTPASSNISRHLSCL